MKNQPGRFPFSLPALSSFVLFATSAHLTLALATHCLWLLRGNQAIFRYYFGYEDPLFLVFCTTLEFFWARLAWRQFAAGQPLRRAWFLIMLSAFCHWVGMILSHILCTSSYINPLFAFHVSGYQTGTAALSAIGLFVGGTLHMVVLAGGLLIAIRLCRRFGIRGKLTASDWTILGGVVVYTLHVAYVIIRLRVGATSPPHILDVMNWANDPLLCVLLFLAFLLRRSMAQMGWGYVSKCWGAYVVAILGTSMASIGMWASDFGILPYPERAVVWYMWPIIYAAFALGPIYQVEAAQAASTRLKDLGL
jgi:hypothetical protein